MTLPHKRQVESTWLVRSRNGFSIEVETKDGKMPIEEAYASRMNLLREVLKYGDKS